MCIGATTGRTSAPTEEGIHDWCPRLRVRLRGLNRRPFNQRSSRLRILPVVVIGSELATSMIRGYLYAAI